MHSQSQGIVNAATFPSEMLSQAPTKGLDAKVKSIVYNPTDNGAGIAESGL